MNFTPQIPREDTFKRVAQCAARLLFYTLAGALLAATLAAPAVAPWHPRLRAVFVTLIPVTVGFSAGALDFGFARRHVPLLLGGAALLLVISAVPHLRTDAPAAVLALGLAGGVAVALALIRLGLLQAGIGWRNHQGNAPEDFAPRWAAALSLCFAWLWLFVALLNPRESFPPTRWLLTLTGAAPSARARQPAEIRLMRVALSGTRLEPERGAVTSNGYTFRVGPLTPGPGTLQVAVSVQHADGTPLDAPMWLTLATEDAATSSPAGDAEYFNVSQLSSGSVEAAAVLASRGAARLTAYAWYNVTQALPAVRLRARLWTLDARNAQEMSFRPVAEADLGTWNLTILRKVQPNRH